MAVVALPMWQLVMKCYRNSLKPTTGEIHTIPGSNCDEEIGFDTLFLVEVAGLGLRGRSQKQDVKYLCHITDRL